eukprot:scaffold7380_cov115-Isochrysis_galbana.AAC.2
MSQCARPQPPAGYRTLPPPRCPRPARAAPSGAGGGVRAAADGSRGYWGRGRAGGRGPRQRRLHRTVGQRRLGRVRTSDGRTVRCRRAAPAPYPEAASPLAAVLKPRPIPHPYKKTKAGTPGVLEARGLRHTTMRRHTPVARGRLQSCLRSAAGKHIVRCDPGSTAWLQVVRRFYRSWRWDARAAGQRHVLHIPIASSLRVWWGVCVVLSLSISRSSARKMACSLLSPPLSKPARVVMRRLAGGIHIAALASPARCSLMADDTGHAICIMYPVSARKASEGCAPGACQVPGVPRGRGAQQTSTFICGFVDSITY